jgi:folate-dependent tRNA-U54 methylase TrmFO/GidA
MNINFGLFPPLPAAEGTRRTSRRERQAALCARALTDLGAYAEISRPTTDR